MASRVHLVSDNLIRRWCHLLHPQQRHPRWTRELQVQVPEQARVPVQAQTQLEGSSLLTASTEVPLDLTTTALEATLKIVQKQRHEFPPCHC